MTVDEQCRFHYVDERLFTMRHLTVQLVALKDFARFSRSAPASRAIFGSGCAASGVTRT